jgi:ribonuclease P protein component
MKPFAFPKTRRLASNRQFKTVLDQGRRAGNSLLTLYAVANGCGYPRVGISVGKSCGKAVVRNRLKRLLREAFRQNQARIPPSFDYVLMISPALSRRLRGPQERMVLKSLTRDRIQNGFRSLLTMLFGPTVKDNDKVANGPE